MKKRIQFLFILILLSIDVAAQNYVVTSIDFKGSKKTNISFLSNLIHTKSGNTLNINTLKEDIIRLIRLPAIANATYTIEKKTKTCTVKIKLDENQTLIPVANLFKTSNEEIAYSIGLFEHNFLQKSISVGAWYQKNIYDSYGANLKAPYLFTPKIGLALNFTNLATQEPVFFPNGTALYKYNNISSEVLGLYQYNFRNKISTGINIFKETYTTTEIIVPGAPESYSLNKILFKLIYTYENLKYNYQYISGFKSELNIQYVTSTEDESDDFAIAWNDFLYYKRLNKKGNWATRLRVGLSKNDETPFAPFAVDNNLNLRGVGNIIDRGTGVIIVNTEYRHTIKENNWYAIQSNIFIDAGTWRNPGGDFGNFTDTNNVRLFSGAGLRFIHKRIFNLVLRADFGFGITKDEPNGLVFGVGQYF